MSGYSEGYDDGYGDGKEQGRKDILEKLALLSGELQHAVLVNYGNVDTQWMVDKLEKFISDNKEK